MNPATTESPQPLSHDWRRRSLLRVRRPTWSGHGSVAKAERDEQPALAEASAPKSHTTANDIAW